MKNNPTIGKYVKRSTYQKLAEENKKLLKDIRILTQESIPSFTKYIPSNQRLEVIKKWRERLKKDESFDELFRMIFSGKKNEKQEKTTI